MELARGGGLLPSLRRETADRPFDHERGAMKQHLLSDGDRAALQALVPLAGALGVGTIFAAGQLDLVGRSRKRQPRGPGDAKVSRFALPQSEPVPTGEGLVCWEKKSKFYLDRPGWLRLRDEAGARWRALATGEACPPTSPKILVDVKVGLRLPAIRDRAVVRISVLEPARGGEMRVQELRPMRTVFSTSRIWASSSGVRCHR